jgi:hypothetical protein
MIKRSNLFLPFPIHYHSLLIDCCVLHTITLCHVSSFQNQQPFSPPQVQGSAGQVGSAHFLPHSTFIVDNPSHSSVAYIGLYCLSPLKPYLHVLAFVAWFIVVFAISP